MRSCTRFCRPPQKHRAEEKALYLLEHRAHSKKELENKITRAKFDREAAEAPWSTWKSWAY